MKSDPNAARFPRAIPSASLALVVSALIGSSALAQEPAKIPRPLPIMTDDKVSPVEPVGAVEWPERIVPEDAQHGLPKPKKSDSAGAPALPPIDFSKVVFDQPGDGLTWARGRTYKASFDAQGATYIPFLGSSAPRNFPVRVELVSARVGGVELALDAHGLTRAGEEVTIERGVLHEVWHLTPDAAEQSFVLASRPDVAGALELSVSLDSELEPREVEGGIELVGEHGRVAIGHTVVVDADGTRTPIASRLIGGRMALDVPAEILASARYPLVVDPVYTTTALETSTMAARSPDISNGGTDGWFAGVYQFAFSQTDSDVWTTDIYFGFVPAGTVGQWVDYTTKSWLAPRIAYNALHDAFLTVAQVRPQAGAPNEIWCRARVQSTNTQLDQNMIQSSILGSCFHPDVGGDPAMTGPTYFMAVWTRNFSTTDWDVHGRLINWDGTPVGATNIFIASTTAFDWYPRISKTNGRPPFATQEWNVVWMRGNGATDIMGAQIHWDGIVTTPAFVIDQSGFNDTFPSASSLLDGAVGPRPWMVAFSRRYPTDDDIILHVLVGSTYLADRNLSVAENAAPYENQLDPDVDSNGQRFTVAYCESYSGSATDHDLYVATLHFTGGALTVDEAHVNVDYSTLDTREVQISGCVNLTNQGIAYYGLAWPRTSPTLEDVYIGAFYEPASYSGFCSGDGSAGACPCGNTGGTGRGCANSATNGAGLFPQGQNFTSADTFSLFAFNLPVGSTCLFFQGTNAAASGSAFGDGLRCVSGSTVRLGAKSAINGTAAYPEAGDLPISQKGGVPSEGGFRAYQVWYRNAAAFCTPATYNLTSGMRVLWLR